MSLCHCCIARIIDGDEEEKLRAAVVRWLTQREGMESTKSLTDAQLLSSPRDSLKQLRQDADELIAVLAKLAKAPPQDPPF